ncbi:MAG: Lrp/AsnC family transcriptional regulator [Candidatus Woesearchaeota archaeon]
MFQKIFEIKKIYSKTALLYLKLHPYIMDTKELQILSQFRKNARENLTTASRNIRVPISTIHERLKKYEGSVIFRHTTLIDFSKIGFSLRLQLMLKIASKDRERVGMFLRAHPRVNTVSIISNGFDYMAEVILKNMQEVKLFLKQLEQFSITERHEFFIIDDMKKEAFLSDPCICELTFKDI